MGTQTKSEFNLIALNVIRVIILYYVLNMTFYKHLVLTLVLYVHKNSTNSRQI